MDFLYDKKPHAKRAATASCQAVFDSSRSVGYIWPKQGETRMITVPLGEAKNNLSKLVDEAAAGKPSPSPKMAARWRNLSPYRSPRGRELVR